MESPKRLQEGLWVPTIFTFTLSTRVTFFIVCFLTGTLAFFFRPKGRRPTINVPLVEPPSAGAYDFSSLLIKGYFDHPNQPYKLAGPKSDLILLPPRYAGELGTYGNSKLSFGAAIHDFWVSPHTTWRYHLDDETGRQTLMGSFKRDGANIVRLVDEEILLAFSQWRDVTDHWSEIAINPSIRPLINRTFGRVLVGAPLCRGKEWLDAANGLGLKLMLAARDLRGFPSWAQPWVKHFLPTYRALMKARRPLVRLSEPLVRRKLSGLGVEKIDGREDHDMIDYQIKHAAGWRAMDVDFHTGQLFDNVFAGDSKSPGFLSDRFTEVNQLTHLRNQIR